MRLLVPELDTPELRTYGAKSLAFDWVLEEWPDAPILPYVKVRREDSRGDIASRVADELDGYDKYIVRSSSPYELKMGSAGLWISARNIQPEWLMGAIGIVKKVLITGT